jgi:hypothetical protein
MGIDPTYGCSAFGIVVTQWVDDHIQILHADEYHRPDYNEMLSLVYGLISKYQVDTTYIDGANHSFIKSLKLQIGEDAEYEKVTARHKSEGLGDSWSENMRIVPVNFNREHKAMLGHCKMILEHDHRKIAISPEPWSISSSLAKGNERVRQCFSAAVRWKFNWSKTYTTTIFWRII